MNDPLFQRIAGLLSAAPRRAVVGFEEYAVGTTIGSVRSRNEDVVLIVRVRYASSPDRDFDLALVCDGMGGTEHGQRAAQLAATVFSTRVLRANRTLPPLARLESAIAAAQAEVFSELRGSGGTTLSAVFTERSRGVWFAHAGDSRVYVLGHEGGLKQVSRDDTLGAALNRPAREHADFNRLIQFVGMDGDLQPQVEPVSTIDPAGIIVTTDGAHSVPDDVLGRVVHFAKGGNERVRRLLTLSEVMGGLDNATVAYLPLVLDRNTPREISEGTVISLLSPNGEFEIWIRQQAEQNERSGGREEPREVKAPEDPIERDVASSPKKRSAGKRKTSKRPKKAPGTPSASDIDGPPGQVTLHFPDDDQ